MPPHTSASRLCPSGRSGRRKTIRAADHAPAAAITVPSPKGMWNSRPSARFRSRKSTEKPISTSATSTNENGPNVLTTSRSEPIPDTRCSKFSRRQVSTTPSAARRGSSERPASAITGVGVVPELDLALARLPAEVDLATVPQGREVDEAALQVAQDHVHRLQLAERPLQLEESLGDDPSGCAAPVGRRRLAEGRPRVLVRELHP